MTTPHPAPAPADTERHVDLVRTDVGEFRVVNERGGALTVGADDADFTPVELLLAALAACSAINVEELTGRRASPSRFAVRSEGHKVRDDGGGRLEKLRLVFDLEFPDGKGGDAARAIVPRVLAQTRDRICTVSRTVHLGTEVEYVEGPR